MHMHDSCRRSSPSSLSDPSVSLHQQSLLTCLCPAMRVIISNHAATSLQHRCWLDAAVLKEAMQVWDYVSDQYVHRLIQSSLDGKLVEVPSPELAAGSGADGAQAAGASAPATGEHAPPGSKGWGKGGGAASSASAQASETTLAMNEDLHMMEVSDSLSVLSSSVQMPPARVHGMFLSFPAVQPSRARYV